MCNIQAVYFTRAGLTLPGPSCAAVVNERISSEVVAMFDVQELGKKYSALTRIRDPDGREGVIATTYKTVTQQVDTFFYSYWSPPIPPGTYTIIGSEIIDEFGNTICSGMPSGGNCQSIKLSAAAPVCNFEIRQANNEITFTDISIDAPTSYEWDFGDGTPSVITASRIVSHTYSVQGIYTVTHKVTGAGGTTTCIKSVDVRTAAATGFPFIAIPVAIGIIGGIAYLITRKSGTKGGQ